MDCPAKLIKDNSELLSIYFRWKRFGLHGYERGVMHFYPDEPALYITVIELLDSERGKHGNA